MAQPRKSTNPCRAVPKAKAEADSFLSSIRGEQGKKTAQVPVQCGGKNAHRGVRDGALYGRGRVSGTPQRVKHPSGSPSYHGYVPLAIHIGTLRCRKDA